MNVTVKKILEEGRADGVFAYRSVHGCLFPFLFTRENMDALEPWKPFKARYPIAKLLLLQARQNPAKTYGVVVRGCEERAINELFKWNQLQPRQVILLGQACSAELAQYCECWKPFPDQLHFGEPVAGIPQSRRVAEIDAKAGEERLDWWLSHFNRCIKCFGCRDVCPVCFCTECSLEHQALIPAGVLPPDTSFHLVRALHMAGRCIDCGLCEEVCPAKIPLRALYKRVNSLVEEIFDYKTGLPEGLSPFSMLGEEIALPEGKR
ncbi:MAG: 4Fe-4S binding protein [Desulfobacterales bacterium]